MPFALWRLGLRPFYLLASLFAALSIALWALQYGGMLLHLPMTAHWLQAKVAGLVIYVAFGTVAMRRRAISAREMARAERAGCLPADP